VFSNHLPPPTLMSLATAHRAAAGAPDLGAQRRQHGDDDTGLREAHRPSAEIWAMPDAMHMAGLQGHRGSTSGRVVGFFDRALSR
jgi:hypothetical protein